ncbi:MAG: response regulator FixJ [Euryarchaeota archaeon ADurb.Bin294]|jgi:PAS domain S-box-containing protein|nr:MAG: response regulator FixJ [Euryarchaeota archaeon ADurb.Bin294]
MLGKNMVSDPPIRVLFVDDEPGMLQAIRDYLSIVHSIGVDICNSGAEALTREDLFGFDCLIIDYEMPDIDGIVLLKEIRQMNTDIPIIIFTGKGHEDVAMEAINAGADFYIKKGGNPEELFTELAHFIRTGVSRHRAEQSLVEKERRYRAVVEDMTEFVCRMNAEGVILFVNSAFPKSLQIPFDTLNGVTFYSLYPDHKREIEEVISLCDPDNPSAQLELPFLGSHGKTIWHSWVIRVIFDDRFDIQEIQAVGRDISRQRELDRQGTILRELGISLASSSTLESALSFSLSAAIEIGGLETGAVYLHDHTSGKLSPFLDQGPYRAALHRLYEEFSRIGDEMILNTGDPLYMSMTDLHRYESRFTALAFIPIIRYEEVTGWFILASDNLIEVPYEIRSPLEGVASQIGNVISRIEAEEALRDALIESEERYMQLSETSPDAIAILSGNSVVYLNPAANALFEVDSPDVFIKQPLHDFLDTDLQNWFHEILKTKAREKSPRAGEGFLKTKNGRQIYGELISVPISHAGEDAILLLIRDKTSQRMQEQALIESERRFREMADLLPEPLFEADTNGKLTFCNRGVFALLSASHVPGTDITMASELVSAQEQLRFSTILKKVANDLMPVAGDFIAAGDPSDPRIIHLSLAPILRDGVFSGTRGILIDITENKRYQEKLHHMIEEKDVLFRELHHRVKNNMQIISSMLQLQEEYITDEVILSALHDCEQRIDSMALVHETLYRTESLAGIPFGQYLEDLAQAVTEGFATVRDIRTEIDVGSIMLSLDTAVTIGLIVNELMVNSMKYAFVDRPSGLITIRLTCEDEGCTMRYSDDGVGLPPGFEIEKISSLGMRLVRILARQIRGSLCIESEPGAGMICTVTFPKQAGNI